MADWRQPHSTTATSRNPETRNQSARPPLQMIARPHVVRALWQGRVLLAKKFNFKFCCVSFRCSVSYSQRTGRIFVYKISKILQRMSAFYLLRLPFWIGLALFFIITNDVFRDFSRVSAFGPTHPTTSRSRFASTLSLYPYRTERQRNILFQTNPQLKILIETRSSSSTIHPSALFLASDPHATTEQTRMRRLLQSYKIVGRVLKKILKILDHFIPFRQSQTPESSNATTTLEPLEITNLSISNTVQIVEEKVFLLPQLEVETAQVMEESAPIIEPLAVDESSTDIISPIEPILELPEIIPSPIQSSPPPPLLLPQGTRWAVSSPKVNLTGHWKILVDDHFKKDYDTYLMNLGQPSLVRTVATSIVELTTEEVRQEDEGRVLHIVGKNLRGAWERTLVASGSDIEYNHGEDEGHIKTPLVTADQEQVQAEAWWESDGTIHRSFLRGGKKYGGGDFESKRYLTENGNILICESTFHPRDAEKSQAKITWKFARI